MGRLSGGNPFELSGPRPCAARRSRGPTLDARRPVHAILQGLKHSGSALSSGLHWSSRGLPMAACAEARKSNRAVTGALGPGTGCSPDENRLVHGLGRPSRGQMIHGRAMGAVLAYGPAAGHPVTRRSSGRQPSLQPCRQVAPPDGRQSRFFECRRYRRRQFRARYFRSKETTRFSRRSTGLQARMERKYSCGPAINLLESQ